MITIHLYLTFLSYSDYCCIPLTLFDVIVTSTYFYQSNVNGFHQMQDMQVNNEAINVTRENESNKHTDTFNQMKMKH